MTRPSEDFDGLKALARRLAEAARPISLSYFRDPALRPDNKSRTGFDPVTAADRACEEAMRAIITRERPADAILGEEFGATHGTSGLTWVLDPIDGTRGFISGTPTWGILIALCDSRGPIFGIIDQPYTGERFEGGLGEAGLTRDGLTTAFGTRRTASLDEAILFSTFPEIGSTTEAAAFAEVAARVRLTRYGMDCYAYALLALGQIDLVIEAGLAPYDILAPIAVVQAAGGMVSDWQGGSAHDGGRVLAAANPMIHAEALAHLARCPQA